MFIFVTCNVSPFAGFAWFLARAVLNYSHSLISARIGHELTDIRDDSPRFARFSLTIVIKKAHTCFRGISSNMNVPRKAAVEIDPAT